jgi:hypothetical protein
VIPVATSRPAPLRVMALTAIACGLVVCSCDAAAKVDGKGVTQVTIRGEVFKVYTYHPPNCRATALLITFHGKHRNAEGARNAAVPLADKACLDVYAPLFAHDRFPGWSYQHGGVVHGNRAVPSSTWTVWFAADLVTWARKHDGRPAAPYYLFGHSAGAQFLSRVSAFASPSGAQRIVISNPSTYVLPAIDVPAPYGFGGLFGSYGAKSQLQHYLALPITILLGREDIGDEELANEPEAVAQGATRLERGIRTYRLAQQVAAVNGWPFNWRLAIVPGVGHDTRGMMSSQQSLQAFGGTANELKGEARRGVR